MFNTIAVQFINQNSNSAKEYAYLTDLDLQVKDIVVVDTPYGFKTAEVTSLFCNEEDAHKWVVCKINTKEFREKLAVLKHKQFVLKQMKQRLDRVDLLSQFTEIAKTDEKMASLLTAYNSKPEIKEIAE